MPLPLLTNSCCKERQISNWNKKFYDIYYFIGAMTNDTQHNGILAGFIATLSFNDTKHKDVQHEARRHLAEWQLA